MKFSNSLIDDSSFWIYVRSVPINRPYVFYSEGLEKLS